MSRQAVRLLQSGRIGHAADGRDCPACAVVGEAVVRIGADGAGYAGGVEREIVVGQVDRSSRPVNADPIEGNRGGVNVDSAARDRNARCGIA